MEERKDRKMMALRYAFPRTAPVLVGYLFLGAAYGILMKVNGYGLLWTFVMSVLVFAGSLQYVGITLLVSVVNPVYALLMSLMINARHLFYGISMLDKFRTVKVCKPYLIFALTDETFSVLCNEEPPPAIDRDWVFLWVSLLDHGYWITGSVIGALMGSLITFNTAGLDFALTALFVVIFVDQWRGQQNHKPAVTGAAASVISLLIFGEGAFIIPAMLLILLAITWDYKNEKKKALKMGGKTV